MEKPLSHRSQVQTTAEGARPPSVGVVVGCFNQASFVEEAIASVAAQTWAEFTCVVVDDCSTDDSATRIAACLEALGDERFSFVRHDGNLGQMATMLTGLDATESNFVAFLDADDAWHPAFLQHHIEAHLHPAGQAALSCSPLHLIDEQSRIIAGSQSNFRAGDPRLADPPRRGFAVVDDEPPLVFVDRGASGWIWSSTSGMVFRRDALEAIRPAESAAIRSCADAYFAPAAHLIGGTVRIERPLGSYRLHHANSWAHGRLIGAGQPMGQSSEAIDGPIRSALLDQLCSISDELAPVIRPDELRASLIAHFGWREIIKAAKSSPAVKRFFSGWNTPVRRAMLRVGSIVPRRLRPSRVKKWLS